MSKISEVLEAIRPTRPETIAAIESRKSARLECGHNQVLYVIGLVATARATVGSVQALSQAEGSAMIYGGEEIVEFMSSKPAMALLAMVGPPLAVKAHRAVNQCRERYDTLPPAEK